MKNEYDKYAHECMFACSSAGVGSGYYSDLATNMSALQLWPEHRYYGYGDYSPADSDYEHLSIEQALVDQVELVLHIQARYNLDRAPVIAIGASYSKCKHEFV